jgi:lipopolysaccharide biosynthesis protein
MGGHLQSYFWLLKSRAFSSQALRGFVEGIVAYEGIEDVISEYEVKFALTLAAAGSNANRYSRLRMASTRHSIIGKSFWHFGFPFLAV